MVSNKLSVFAAAAAFSQVALAGNPHQMLHGRAHMEDKRAVVVHTVVQTVYVNAAAPTVVVDAPVPEEVVPEAVVEAPVVKEKKKTVVKPETTSHSTTSGSSGISTKRGVTYRYADYGIGFLDKCEKCSWVHNWDSAANGDIGDATFVPTMWGEKEDHIQRWDANKQSALDSGLKTFFSFNEPDLLPEFSKPEIGLRMEPDYAVTAHSKYFSGMPADAYIAAPSVTNGENDIVTGLAWLKQFVSGCNANSDCRFDFCNVHWYSDLQYEATLFDHVKNAYDVCNEGNTGAKKKVWLTEFKTNTGTPEEKADWLNTAIPKLEALDQLEAYSYFMADPTEMMVSPSVLKADGTAFATV